jgi:hypothetical protein
MAIGLKIVLSFAIFLVIGLIIGAVASDINEERVVKFASILSIFGIAGVIFGLLVWIWYQG